MTPGSRSAGSAKNVSVEQRDQRVVCTVAVVAMLVMTALSRLDLVGCEHVGSLWVVSECGEV